MSKTPEEKFNNINIEPDTIIQSFRFIKIDGIDCRYEEWIWDGIEAESLIFCTSKESTLSRINSFLDFL